MGTVDAFLAGIEAGKVPAEVFDDDVVLDATVPNWRFSTRGGAAVQAELSRWYADPGTFASLSRTRFHSEADDGEQGELVEFTLTWQEKGIGHMCHQAHILRVRDGAIVSDTAFCGGRWPAPLIAEMAAARQSG